MQEEELWLSGGRHFLHRKVVGLGRQRKKHQRKKGKDKGWLFLLKNTSPANDHQVGKISALLGTDGWEPQRYYNVGGARGERENRGCTEKKARKKKKRRMGKVSKLYKKKGGERTAGNTRGGPRGTREGKKRGAGMFLLVMCSLGHT